MSMAQVRLSVRWILLAVFLIGSMFSAQVAVHADDNKCLLSDASGCTYGLPTFQYQALLGEMLANPAPNVRPLEVDETELGRTALYRIVGGTAPLYDAPDGNPVGAINSGFDYVNVIKQQGDWVQIMPKRWTQAENITTAASSPYAGVLFDTPLPYIMAWVLVPTRPSPAPGLKADPATPMLERYHRVNIFATVTIDTWDWYLVGPGQWIEQRRVARVMPTKRPDGVKGRWVAVDLYDQVLEAYEDDTLVFATLVSTGQPRPGFGTNKGLFRIWARLKADNMTGEMGSPDYYNLLSVPYVMYYDGAISLHGTYWHDGFGYRHSHGCVNMSVTDAHWMYDWTGGFYSDLWVYVYSSRDYIKSMPAAE
ncbi:MAG: L,D-transpeptidase [Chloroflexota bacterium]